MGLWSYFHFIAFWVAANCSQLGTHQEFFYAKRRRTINLDLLQCTLCFPLALHLGILKVVSTYTSCVRGKLKKEKNKRIIKENRKLKPLQKQGPVSTQWKRQPCSTVWTGMVARGFYQKEGKVSIKASGKFYGVWDC